MVTHGCERRHHTAHPLRHPADPPSPPHSGCASPAKEHARVALRSTGKRFELEFCTGARWQDGEIVEENLFYDQVGFLKPIGVMEANG
jgi:hypothetical protein